MAQALLLSRGLRFSRHGQVIAQYGRHFARTGLLDPRFHRLLNRAFRLRQLADYAAAPTFDPEVVKELKVTHSPRNCGGRRSAKAASPSCQSALA